MPNFFTGKRIYIAGHRGMVGSGICRALENSGATLLTATSKELDLRNQAAVNAWFAKHKPQLVFLAAAKVGGILANSSYPAEFIYDNLAMELNVVHAAHTEKVEKLLFLGSSCIYPKFAEQPITEQALLTGALEPTNEWYAIAKIAGIKLCQAYAKQYGSNFITAQPTNLYGIGDNFALTNSHVLPALLRKFHEAKKSGAKEVTIWGSGTPRREFLFVDDLAEALLFLMQHYNSPEIVNIGTGEDITIKNLATLIGTLVGFNGALTFDATKPDGTPRKLLDVDKMRKLGWQAKTPLEQGIKQTYEWFQQNETTLRT
jgi:GDP-L-fucose synthase